MRIYTTTGPVSAQGVNMATGKVAVLDQPMGTFHVVSHQLSLARVADAIAALNGDYRLDGSTAIKIAIAPNGPVL